MDIRRFVVGPLFTNCYLLTVGGEAAVVDPGGLTPELEQALDGVELKYILLTHGHFDHAEAAELLQARTGASICYHPQEKSSFWALGRTPPPLDRELKEGDEIILGPEKLLVWHLPGHSPGSLAFLWQAGKVALVGDVLFAGSVGRTDLPGGSWESLERSLRRLLSLDGAWKILAGHGPETDLDRERRLNPFLQGLDHA